MLRLLLILGLLLLVEYYAFQAVRTVAQSWGTNAQRTATWVYWLITGLFYGGLLLISVIRRRGTTPMPWAAYAFSTLLAVWVAKLVTTLFPLGEDVVRAAKVGLNAVLPAPPRFDPGRARFISLLGMGVAAVPFAALIYGMVRGATDFRVRRLTLRYPNLPPAFDGFRILQISDLHVGSYADNTEPLERAVRLINEQAADLVVMTGDLVNNIAPEAEPHLAALRGIRSKEPILSVLGNHDYGDYVTWDSPAAKTTNLDRLKAHHRAIGWDLLLNEHRVIERDGHQLAVLGVENWSSHLNFPRYGDLARAHRGTAGAPFKLLLSHDPSHWDAQVLTDYPDIDLVLSGHTHGMQFGVNLPFMKWSPVQYVYKQWAGLYEKGRQRLYVNAGLGYIGYPGRVGFLPEITVIELKRG